MAEKDIIQNLIFQPGQSQNGRMPEELGIHFADVDERTDEELLLFTKNFAEFVNFYNDDPEVVTGNWVNFFPKDLTSIRELLNNQNGAISPHLAAYLSFLKLYIEAPQQTINGFTGRHLDFYFRDVLRFTTKPAIADKAHVLIELKKNSLPISLSTVDLFTAGKDKAGIELVYAPTGETVLNLSKVESLRCIYFDRTNRGIIRYAPEANSSDGMGGKLEGDEPRWYAFGKQTLPPVEIGFSIASPVLRLKEGVRKVNVTLTLDNITSAAITDANLKKALQVHVTGEKGWLGPFGISPTLNEENILNFNFTIPATEKGVVDYNSLLHGYQYTTNSPILQVLLNTKNHALGYTDFEGIKIKKAKISVDVTSIASITLENDNGVLDPTKPFAPFGQQPNVGSHFLVGYNEALDKKLSELTLNVTWKNPPSSFAAHYSGYGPTINNDSFNASVAFSFGDHQSYSEHSVPLFNMPNAATSRIFKFTPGQLPTKAVFHEADKAVGLKQAKTNWSKRLLHQYTVHRPVLMMFPSVPAMQKGFIRVSLNSSFYHTDYTKKSVENIMNFSKNPDTKTPYIALNEPYTPIINSISLSYKAYSEEVSIFTNSLDDFTNNEIQFFHVAYFGQIQEHSYQRNLFGFLADKSVSWFPEYKNEGELLIGLSRLKEGDSVSVLFQVAEGSEDPDIVQADIKWSVMCDNYWMPLSKSEVVLDTTNKLLQSGIIKFVIPREATTDNTLMPSNRIWIKAAIEKNVKAVCQLVAVKANALEVKYVDSGNDINRLSTPLEKNKIVKLKNGHAAVKAVDQPYASFGGQAQESSNSFYTRGAERLRHKNRCVTAWDYERIILQEYPNVHKVKCIPHAKFIPSTNNYCWLAPGNVVIVVIPDLKNRNAVDPLAPKVDNNTISRITSYVKEHSGMQVNVKVKNPNYQKVMVEFKVRFRPGFEFNYYSQKLDDQLKQFLSPWAFTPTRDISFGGKIYKSVLLDFVEDIEYVDYVEDFYMYGISELTGRSNDLNEIQPETPDTILVSNTYHSIHQV